MTTQGVKVDKHEPGTQKDYKEAKMSYYVYFPPGNPPQGAWPILLFTHGIGEATYTLTGNKRAPEWVKKELKEIQCHGSPPELCATKPATAQLLLNSFIVVSPQFPFYPDLKTEPKRRNWRWGNQVAAIEEILTKVIAKFRGDPKRIYATGFSRGGRGALEIAQKMKNHKIAKLVLVDSESLPNAKTKIPTWIHCAGPRTLQTVVDSYQALIKQSGADRWKKASLDEKVPSSKFVRTNWDLNLGDDKKNHNATSRNAYSDSRIYEWLLAS